VFVKKYFLLMPCLLFAGCSSSIQIVVKDGNCKPIQNAQIYHQEKGVELFVPWGPFFTNDNGIVVLPSKSIEISITKDRYKSAFIEKPSSKITDVFLYAESEKYESGLIDFKKCKDKP
jgi:hypothetical protein